MLFLLLLLNFAYAIPSSNMASSVVSYAPQPLASSSVVGVVLDASGKPLVGARVLATDQRTRHSLALESETARGSDKHPVFETETDIDGKFRISGLHPGTGRLAVRAPMHETVRLDRVYLAARGTSDLNEIRLAPGTAITGLLLDVEQAPIIGAKIYSFPRIEESRGLGAESAALETKTDHTGRFRLDALPLGEWALLVEADGFATHRFEGALEKNDPNSRSLALRLQPEAYIRGTVRSIPSVQDLSHLVVRAIPAAELDEDEFAASHAQGYVETSVDMGGSFKLEGVRDQTPYFIRAQLRSQKFTDADAWSSVELVVSGDERASPTWLPSARVAFRALDVAKEGFAKRYDLTFEGTSPRKPTIAESTNGKQLIKRVRPTDPRGVLQIFASGNGYREFTSRDFELEPGGLIQAGDVALWSHPTITLRVVDALTKRPIHRAHVILKEEASKPPPYRSFTGTTAADGKLTINDTLGVPRRIGISAPGYATKVMISPFELVEGELRVELEQGFDLTVLVSDSDGQPVPAEGVVAKFTSDADKHLFAGTPHELKTSYTDEEGFAWFHHLGSSEYEFVLAAWKEFVDVFAPRNIRLEAGPTRELQFGIDSRTRFEGRVLEAGLPISGAEVRVNHLRQRTNADGNYVFADVDPRANSVTIAHPSQAMDHSFSLRLQLTDNELDCVLPSTIIRGQVLDERGVPLVDAEVFLYSDRWRHAGILDYAQGENLFRIAERTQAHAIARTNNAGAFTIRGVSESLGVTLSARTREGLVGHTRVRGIRAGAEIVGADIVVRKPAELQIPGLNEPVHQGRLVALVAEYSGESQAGTSLRVLAPYTGQAWNLTQLPPGKWELSLVWLSDFGAILSSDELEQTRLSVDELVVLPLDR